MNKFIIGILLLTALIFSISLFSHNTVRYVATVDDEVTQIETELALLDRAVSEGTLSPESAYQARVALLSHLDSIEVAVTSSNSATLNATQRKILIDGLARLKNVLILYKDTLVAVDISAELVTDKPRLKKGDYKKTISAVIAETIDIVEEHVDEAVQEYVPEEEKGTLDEDMMDDASSSPETVLDDTVEIIDET